MHKRRKSIAVPQDDPNDNITDSEPFKFKSRFTNSADNAGTTNVELAVPFKCFNL